MREHITTLKSAVDSLREPIPSFALGAPAGSGKDEKALNDPYEGDAPEFSFFSDVRQAQLKNNQAAQGRLMNAVTSEGKAMSEGVPNQGGYFVQRQVERQIVEASQNDNVLRDLVSKLNITTNELQLDQLTVTADAAWTAELAEKYENTASSLASVLTSVFTVAGLATVSNQLLADSTPSIDQLVIDRISKKIADIEEISFLSGTGVGQPLGILNTPGIQTQGITDGGVTTSGGLLDAILDGIGKVQATVGEPSAIVMHPRTWTRVLKARDAQGVYLVGAPSPQNPRSSSLSIFGYPVVLSNRLPTNLGTGSNESRIIIGDFKEALILDRQGLTIDSSEHVKFTSNATIFRAEKRLGFTAAQNPTAFAVVGGTGLANG
jgi:HK97 family phage major capsid protein